MLVRILIKNDKKRERDQTQKLLTFYLSIYLSFLYIINIWFYNIIFKVLYKLLFFPKIFVDDTEYKKRTFLLLESIA